MRQMNRWIEIVYAGDDSAHRLFPVDQYPGESGERAAREVAERNPDHIVMMVEEDGPRTPRPRQRDAL